MNGYLQRLMDSALAVPATGVAPSARSRSPLIEADQRLGIPGIAEAVWDGVDLRVRGDFSADGTLTSGLDVEHPEVSESDLAGVDGIGDRRTGRLPVGKRQGGQEGLESSDLFRRSTDRIDRVAPRSPQPHVDSGHREHVTSQEAKPGPGGVGPVAIEPRRPVDVDLDYRSSELVHGGREVRQEPAITSSGLIPEWNPAQGVIAGHQSDAPERGVPTEPSTRASQSPGTREMPEAKPKAGPQEGHAARYASAREPASEAIEADDRSAEPRVPRTSRQEAVSEQSARWAPAEVEQVVRPVPAKVTPLLDEPVPRRTPAPAKVTIGRVEVEVVEEKRRAEAPLTAQQPSAAVTAASISKIGRLAPRARTRVLFGLRRR